MQRFHLVNGNYKRVYVNFEFSLNGIRKLHCGRIIMIENGKYWLIVVTCELTVALPSHFVLEISLSPYVDGYLVLLYRI